MLNKENGNYSVEANDRKNRYLDEFNILPEPYDYTYNQILEEKNNIIYSIRLII